MAAPGLEFKLSAELGGFLQQMQQGDRAVNQAMASMGRSAQALEGRLAEVSKSAKSSAAVFVEFERAGNEFRALQGQRDPAVRALHEYQRAQMLVSAAVEAGAVSQDRANAVLAQARVRYEAAANGMAIASSRGAGGITRMGGAMQGAGYQVADLAVQLQAGTNPMIAFTQQGSQLVSMFGPWGAAIGAAGAVMGALAVHLWDAGDAAEELEFDIGALESGVSGLESIVREYERAIKATGTAQAAASGQIVAETRREFEAKQQLLGLELKSQQAKQAERQVALSGVRRELEAGPDYSNAVAGPGPASLYAGSSTVADTRTRAEEVFNAKAEALRDQVTRYESEVTLAAGAIDRTTEAIAMSWEEAMAAFSGGGSKGGKTPADKLAEIAQKLQEMTVAARNQAYEFGLSGEALAEFKAETEAYNLVAEAMVNATPEQAARLRELAEGYIDAAVAVERKREAREDATEAAKAAKQAEEDLQSELSPLVSGFSSAIQNADSFADALKRVGIQLAELALKGALLGEGPFAKGGAGASLFKTVAGAVLGGMAGGIGGGLRHGRGLARRRVAHRANGKPRARTPSGSPSAARRARYRRRAKARGLCDPAAADERVIERARHGSG